MKSVLKWLAIGFVGLIVVSALIDTVGGGDEDEATDNPPAQTEPEPTPSPVDAEPEPAPVVREEPDPKGDYDLDCDYELGDFGESGNPAKGFRFIAGGTLVNTGNIGIRVRVTYKWKRLGQDALVVRKHYRVRTGQSRDVNITIPVSSDDIDAHQSADGECSTKADIVDTFGQTPLEE